MTRRQLIAAAMVGALPSVSKELYSTWNYEELILSSAVKVSEKRSGKKAITAIRPMGENVGPTVVILADNSGSDQTYSDVVEDFDANGYLGELIIDNRAKPVYWA